VVHTEVVSIKEFGKKDPSDRDASSYDSDDEAAAGGGMPAGVQCGQN
jgi:hypothetical protein